MHILAQFNQALTDFAQRRVGLLATPSHLCTSRLDGENGQSLCHVVVKLSCKSRALVLLRANEPFAKVASCLLRSLTLYTFALQAPSVHKQDNNDNGFDQADCGAGGYIPFILL